MDNIDRSTHKLMTGVLYGTSTVGLILLIIVVKSPYKWVPILLHLTAVSLALYSHKKYYSHKMVNPIAKKFLVVELILMFGVILFGMHDYEHIFLLLVVGDCIMAFDYRFSLPFTVITYLIYYPLVHYIYPFVTGVAYGTDYVDDVMIVGFVVLALFIAKRQTQEKVRYNILLEERNEAYAELARFSEKIEESAINDERSRIALMLHNTIGHMLVATNMRLQAEKMELISAGTLQTDAFGDVEKSIQRTMSLLRQTVEGEEDYLLAMPFDEIMHLFIEDVVNNSQVQVHYEADNVGEIPESLKRLVFNIVMESITNSLKHAAATNIKVSIKCQSSKVTIEVSDDGVGFKDIRYGFGTRRLKELIEQKGGSYSLRSDNGCSVFTSLPLEG